MRIFSHILITILAFAAVSALGGVATAQTVYSTVQSNATPLTRRRVINCTGYAYCSDDSTNHRTKIDVGSAGSGGLSLSAMSTAGAPTVSNVGTAGGTTYTYYVVAVDRYGNKTLPSSAGTTTTGNATLDANNYNHLVWTAVTGAATYDVLQADTAHSIATGVTALTYDDKGGAASGYTAPTRNATADLKLDGSIGWKTGSAIASATTITPTKTMFHVTGTTTISTITAPNLFASGVGGCIFIIPDGIFATDTNGNIALASTSVVNKTLIMCYDPGTSKWTPSY